MSKTKWIKSKCLAFVLLVFFAWALNSLQLWHQVHHEASANGTAQASSSSPHKKNTSQKIVRYYSYTRGDRAGSAILDMLTAHAYSFHQGQEQEGQGAQYGGSCNLADLPYQTLPAQRELIATLGLVQELPFACPPLKKNSTWHRIISYAQYTSHESAIFNQQWLNYIRSKATIPQMDPAQITDPTTIQIVAHVRRGDVTFCHTAKHRRYMPNQYYLDLIEAQKQQHQQKYAPHTPTFNVSIFSNVVDPNAHNAHEPKESWDDFTSRGYHVYLGSDLAQTWLSMMTADVLIMSKSAFSHVPAMFNQNGTVVYTAYWTEPMPGWRVVPRNQSRKANQQVRRMAHKRCPPLK